MARVMAAAARVVRGLEARTSVFGSLPDGRRVDAITLSNKHGMEVTLVEYGATIVSVKVPSKASAAAEEVTLCHGSLDDLRTKSPYYGCTVGRFANRIAKGKFVVDGESYAVARNNGANHLHGGVVGFDKILWRPRVYVNADAAGVEFSYRSHDGEEGYPGNVDVVADYSLTDGNELCMRLSASTDRATPINLCNHTYWNLSGGMREDVRSHVLRVHCPFYLPVDATSIPTGVAPVSGTLFDFTTEKAIGRDLLSIPGDEPGYDHCFARVRGGAEVPPTGLPLAVIADLRHDASGRRMLVSTNQPGVQVYTGNYLSKDAKDAPHCQHQAVCLETENFPDAPNQASFPSAILRPGEKYEAVTVHKFEW